MTGRLRQTLRQTLRRWRLAPARRAAIAAWVRSGAGPTGRPEPITLARIVGNDLFPRHADGQALRNLAFILEREPAFEGCQKLFVLNRLIDAGRQAEAEAMVAAHGHDALVLPFEPARYAAIAIDTRDFGGDGHFRDAAFAALPPTARDRDRLWACAPKIRYAMNVNGARNAALDWGRRRGGWTIVLDGSCFVSAEAFARIRDDMAAPPRVPYLVIPMIRMASNEDVDRVLPVPDLAEEPQIAVHASARERFDEAFPYGLRDKTSLLQRLGVPGGWDGWAHLPRLPARADASPDRHLYKRAGASVFRLSSGVADGRLERAGSWAQRYRSRNLAVLRTLAMLDDRFGAIDAERLRIVGGPEAVAAPPDSPAGPVPPPATAPSRAPAAPAAPSAIVERLVRPVPEPRPPAPRAKAPARARTPRTVEGLRQRTLVVGLGAMKSGTTWLSHYLAQHPQFHHSAVKEMNAFVNLGVPAERRQEDWFRVIQMEALILDEGVAGLVRRLPRLRALAALGRIATLEDYLAYFAARIGDETHFGECSPSYAHLGPDMLRTISTITADVRFLFLMRDPTLRAASHIRHRRRRARPHSPVAELVGEVAPGNQVYARSDYGRTLDAIEEAGVRDRTLLMVYESMFRPEVIRGLCGWLGLAEHPADMDEQRNGGTGETLDAAQMAELRRRLQPVYDDLRARGLEAATPEWWWDPARALGA